MELPSILKIKNNKQVGFIKHLKGRMILSKQMNLLHCCLMNLEKIYISMSFSNWLKM